MSVTPWNRERKTLTLELKASANAFVERSSKKVQDCVVVILRCDQNCDKMIAGQSFHLVVPAREVVPSLIFCRFLIKNRS